MSAITQQVPEQVTATPEMLRSAIVEGGYASVTVRGLTGQHVTVDLVTRKKDGQGRWISRATQAGRVPFAEADCIEVRDPRFEYPENYVGRYYRDTGVWKAGKGADGLRVWTAERLIAAALGGPQFKQAEVFLATRCKHCGRKLTHPESIEALTGEECGNRVNQGKAAKVSAPPAMKPEPQPEYEQGSLAALAAELSA